MSEQIKNICVVTGTRAEYGLLFYLLKELNKSTNFNLQIAVTGTHLSPEFGNTYQQIEQDGFLINAKIEMLLSSDTPIGIAKSIGLGVIGFADAFDRLKPDIIVLLGDRYETLAAAQAALPARIPLVHIHGGEATEGLIDEAIRHSLTKMSHVHFVTAEPYRNRVIQMGEDPKYCFNVSAPGLDNIGNLDLIDKKELEEFLGIDLKQKIFIVTYHPVTLEEKPSRSINNLINALNQFDRTSIVFTGTNADTSGREIRHLIENYVRKKPRDLAAVETLGQRRYLSLMHYADVVIGNSSSGILEAPAMGVPTVNIGIRQKGRLTAPSVISCKTDEDSIKEAIQKALSDEHIALTRKKTSPFGQPGAAKRMVDHLNNINWNKIIIKSFHDILVK
ncbi:UDP-N-acetylglucosamine 2-epimerase [Terasakiella sp. SH-1]|uniref:UDP-N-acetylglucosamine 2-epimerase n=1 Tax=Terasakiella sp. SH-1 TaxID=2560057 RepID=UPI001072ED3A|nr:UDP-N-acetylglucosamine 2-epimerase [Terasakiella sp. SH-1]